MSDREVSGFFWGKRAVGILIGILSIILFAGVTYGGSIELPRTGQTVSYYPEDDGDIEAGVPWPSPRFRDNGEGTVTDNLTGLVWLKDANCMATGYFGFDTDGTLGDGAVTWQHALDFVAGINNGTYSNCGAGQTDWRLPNINELESLFDAGQGGTSVWLNYYQGFNNVQSYYYWSSTTAASNPESAWVFEMWLDFLGFIGKANPVFVWPVRGTTAPPAQLWSSGQATKYSTGDDGDLQKGVSWPSSRFTVIGDCIVDNLTDLTWAEVPVGTMTWQEALDYASGLNLCGYTDWRLPNRKELRSLIHYGQSSTADWLNSQGFNNVLGGYHWSSTTMAGSTEHAWIVDMYVGYTGGNSKPFLSSVLAVRTGGVFLDVPIGYWAKDYIIAIYNAHVTTGYGDGRYGPEDNVSREQMAAFIVRAVEGEPSADYCDSGTPFPDVTPDMWSCKYIKRLKELGITTGYQDGTYRPYDLVPREQMAAFLVRAAEGEPPENYCDSGSLFPDVTPDMWSCRYIKRLKELNITTGYQDGTYGPDDYVTRAQMAAFLARAFLGAQ
jgi:hypothetical protein